MLDRIKKFIKNERRTSRPTSPTSETDYNTKHSQDKIKAELELALGMNHLANELTDTHFEKDHIKSIHKLDKISNEINEILNIHTKSLIDNSIPLPKDARLKEAKLAIQDAEIDLQDVINRMIFFPQSIQQMLKDAQKEIDAGHFATAKDYAHMCSKEIGIVVKKVEQQKEEQARKQKELEQLCKDASEQIKSAKSSLIQAEKLGAIVQSV